MIPVLLVYPSLGEIEPLTHWGPLLEDRHNTQSLRVKSETLKWVVFYRWNQQGKKTIEQSAGWRLWVLVIVVMEINWPGFIVTPVLTTVTNQDSCMWPWWNKATDKLSSEYF